MSEIYMFRGVEFDLGFADFHASEHNLGLIEALNTKNRMLPSGEFTYRIINHWEENNLLTSTRKNDTGWRKYSIMDMVWVYIIRELRNFGFSLEQTALVKKHLSDKKEKVISEFPVLEYYITLCLYNKPAYLLVFSNGEAHPLSEKEYQLNRELNPGINYILIKLNHIIQKIMPAFELKANYKHDYEPSLDERKAIAYLRMVDYQEITIAFENGSSRIIDTANPESQIPVEEIIRIISSKEYETVTIKHDSGKYFHFKRKGTHKVPKPVQPGLFD